MSIVQGLCSVAPCLALALRFATFRLQVREDAERILANAAKNKNLSYYNAAHR